jgi:poly(3-hydroxybutyrate) depolymerase
MKKMFLVHTFILLAAVCLGQEVHHFTEGLMITGVARYGREALYTDQFAYRMYTNTLTKPAAGDSFGVSQRGQGIKWQTVTADSLRRLRVRGGFGGLDGSGGYIYLTYQSPVKRVALLNIKGNSTVFFNNEIHTGDPYSSGWLYIPIQLKVGFNELYVRGLSITADLIFPEKPIFLNTEDATLPFIVLGNNNSQLMGAVVFINSSLKKLKGLKIQSKVEGKTMITDIPLVPPMCTRKVIFNFNGTAVSQKGKYDCVLQVLYKGKVVDEKKISIDAVAAGEKYSNTFISAIDGSLQYYAVTPQSPSVKENAALFLSVHGAGVEAIGQARAYQSKDWGTLVAATNRRPRGFNWEDWGRIDALEVLEIAKKTFKPDLQQVYLTGHSMGGHGTWFLGATYPDKWAAIAPCAGYPTLKEYGSADGLIPVSSSSPIEQILLRSSNQSDVLKLVGNYKPFGVYVFHGDADRVVPVRFARQMRKLLSDFHGDMSYYEYPGGEHWFGDQSVDWKPLFDFFKWHKRALDSSVNTLDFTTANPGISSSYRWISIHQQIHPLQYSRVVLNRNKKINTIGGVTENVRLLKINLSDFGNNASVNIILDSVNTIQYNTKTNNDSIFLKKKSNKWVITEKPDLSEKGPHRYGTFKDPFNHNMLFVYGTKGTKEENEWSFNKARYDAEAWYYRGNGAIDIISDKEYSLEKYPRRNVILFGNASTNSAYGRLLADCPIKIDKNVVRAGNAAWQGDDLGAYFVWPVRGSATVSVGVISGTGLKGMQAANANQYFAGGSGFPDFMIFRLDMLKSGTDQIKLAGFFDNNWKLDANEFILNK